MKKAVYLLALSLCALTIRVTAQDISAFGAKGDGVTDDFPAFMKAVASGAKTIRLGAHTYFLNNGADPRLPNMLVLKDVKIIGTTGTVIRFNYTGLPLFTFMNSQSGEVRNITFLFDGLTQMHDDYKWGDIFARLGVKYMSAGKNFYSVIFSAGSYHLTLEDLVFQSAHPGDTTRALAMCITIMANDQAPTCRTGDLTIRNIVMNDCSMGMMVGGQDHFLLENIESQRRYGTPFLPPGHIIYFVGSGGNRTNVHGYIRNVIDLGHPDNLNGLCLAPLSVKFIDSSAFDNIISFHPEGLIQSFRNVDSVSLNNLIWVKTDAADPSAPFLMFAGPEPTTHLMFNNMFISAPKVTACIKPGFDTTVMTNIFVNSRITPKNTIFDIVGVGNTFKNVLFYPSNHLDPKVTKPFITFGKWPNNAKVSSANAGDFTVTGTHKEDWLSVQKNRGPETDAMNNRAHFKSAQIGDLLQDAGRGGSSQEVKVPVTPDNYLLVLNTLNGPTYFMMVYSHRSSQFLPPVRLDMEEGQPANAAVSLSGNTIAVSGVTFTSYKWLKVSELFGNL